MSAVKKLIIVLTAVFLGASNLDAQVAVKTNLIPDATLSPSLGLEFGLSDKLTFDISGSLALWNTWNSMKMKHWAVQPELRYWFCQTFSGAFIAAHLIGGQFNVANINNDISFLGSDFSKLKDSRYQGWAAGAGLGLGYALPLGAHWNLEAEAGFGYAYVDYEKYECYACGKKVGEGTHNYIGPTKLAINLVYLF